MAAYPQQQYGPSCLAFINGTPQAFDTLWSVLTNAPGCDILQEDPKRRLPTLVNAVGARWNQLVLKWNNWYAFCIINVQIRPLIFGSSNYRPDSVSSKLVLVMLRSGLMHQDRRVMTVAHEIRFLAFTNLLSLFNIDSDHPHGVSLHQVLLDLNSVPGYSKEMIGGIIREINNTPGHNLNYRHVLKTGRGMHTFIGGVANLLTHFPLHMVEGQLAKICMAFGAAWQHILCFYPDDRTTDPIKGEPQLHLAARKIAMRYLLCVFPFVVASRTFLILLQRNWMLQAFENSKFSQILDVSPLINFFIDGAIIGLTEQSPSLLASTYPISSHCISPAYHSKISIKEDMPKFLISSPKL